MILSDLEWLTKYSMTGSVAWHLCSQMVRGAEKVSRLIAGCCHLANSLHDPVPSFVFSESFMKVAITVCPWYNTSTKTSKWKTGRVEITPIAYITPRSLIGSEVWASASFQFSLVGVIPRVYFQGVIWWFKKFRKSPRHKFWFLRASEYKLNASGDNLKPQSDLYHKQWSFRALHNAHGSHDCIYIHVFTCCLFVRILPFAVLPLVILSRAVIQAA